MIPINMVDGTRELEEAMLYRPPSRQLADYLQSNFSSAMERIRSTNTTFINRLNDLYHRYTSDEAIVRAKDVLYDSSTYLHDDVITRTNYHDLNNTTLANQRYIMASPEIGRLHRRNMVHGFQDTFKDFEEGIYGEDRTDYKRVMDGIMQFDEEGNAFYNKYYFVDETGDMDLTDNEKYSILESWKQVSYYLAQGIDPTDPDSNL